LSVFLLTLAALSPLFAATPQFDPAKEEQAVKQAAARFYSALNDMFQGDLTEMKAVWSHADDVTYMGPNGGIEQGWEAVLTNWETQAAKKLGGKVEPKNARVTVGPDLAIFTCCEEGENFVNGKPQKVSIRATNVFRKENGQWKLIGHHTDLLPFLN
jgi:ketosteroid isomerase-like protein